MFALVEDCLNVVATPPPDPAGTGARVVAVVGGTAVVAVGEVVVGLTGPEADSLGRGIAVDGGPESDSSPQPSGDAEQPVATSAAAIPAVIPAVIAVPNARRRRLGGELIGWVLGLASVVTRRWSTELLSNLTQLPRRPADEAVRPGGQAGRSSFSSATLSRVTRSTTEASSPTISSR